VILLVFLQVLLRYIFKVSVFWTEELARLLFTWITLLGAAVALREDEHIYINIFIKRIPKKFASIIVFLYDVFILIFFVFLLRGFYCHMQLVRESHMVALALSYYYVYLGAIVSYTVLVIYLIRRIIHKISQLRKQDYYKA